MNEQFVSVVRVRQIDLHGRCIFVCSFFFAGGGFSAILFYQIIPNTNRITPPPKEHSVYSLVLCILWENLSRRVVTWRGMELTQMAS